MQKNRVNSVGERKEDVFWCESKNKIVIHTYFECSMPKRAFGRVCTQRDEACPFECEYSKNNE